MPLRSVLRGLTRKAQERPTYRRCEMGPIAFDDLNHRLVAEYKRTSAINSHLRRRPRRVNCEPERCVVPDRVADSL